MHRLSLTSVHHNISKLLRCIKNLVKFINSPLLKTTISDLHRYILPLVLVRCLSSIYINDCISFTVPSLKDYQYINYCSTIQVMFILYVWHEENTNDSGLLSHF